MKKLTIIGVFTANILLGTLIASLSYNKEEQYIANAQANVLTEQEMSGLSLQKNYNRIAQIANPAVLSIQVDALAEDEFQKYYEDFDFFKHFWGEAPRTSEKKHVHGSGSGFIISSDGYVVTNYHVVKNAEKIIVSFDEEKEVEVKVIGSDEKTDIALLKIPDGKDLPYVSLGDSDKINIGDIVVAIGNPFNLSHTFTAGVVSAKGRNNLDNSITTVQDFIQTDVAINPGNSGGPLINLKGEVIGINSMILSPGNSGSIGIGFSIPINLAKYIINQLKKNGTVERGYIGVAVDVIEPSVAKTMKLKSDSNIYVASVVPESPAEYAGLKQGDIILTFNNKKIHSPSDLINEVSSLPVNIRVPMTVLRDGKEIELSIKLEKSNSKQASSLSPKENPLQIVVVDITPKNQNEYNSPFSSGVVISQINNNSILYQSGVRVGDIIIKINNNEIDNQKTLFKLIDQQKNNEVVFSIIRNKKLHLLTVQIPNVD